MDSLFKLLDRLQALHGMPMWAWAIVGVALLVALVKALTSFLSSLDRADGTQDKSGICWLLVAIAVVEAPFAALGGNVVWHIIRGSGRL